MMTENSVSKQVDDQQKINRYTVVSNKFVPMSCTHAELFGHCANTTTLQWQRGGGAPHSPVRKKVLGSISGLFYVDFTGSLCVCGFSFHSPQTLTSLSIGNSWPCDKYVNNWCVSCDRDLSFIPVTHSRKCRKTQLMVSCCLLFEQI